MSWQYNIYIFNAPICIRQLLIILSCPSTTVKNYITMMKHYLKRLINRAFKPLLVGALTLSANWASAQLTGSYTIDPSAAASSTNFQTWAALATYFNTNGISGATTVTVKGNDIAGTSVVTFTQPATNPTSSTKTLTIDGGNFCKRKSL
jgi:hypothetical protein